MRARPARFNRAVQSGTKKSSTPLTNAKWRWSSLEFATSVT